MSKGWLCLKINYCRIAADLEWSDDNFILCGVQMITIKKCLSMSVKLEKCTTINLLNV